MSPALIPGLLLAIPGTLAARRLAPGAPHPARLGMGLLLGLSGGPFLIFLAGVARAPLTAPVVLLILGIAGAGITLYLARWRARRPAAPGPARIPWTPAEMILALAIGALLLLSAWRAGFYPVTALDAHSYDGRARWIAAEHTLAPSVYAELQPPASSNLLYPPLFPLSLSLAYWAGAAEAKPVVTLYYAALLLVVWGWMSRWLPRIGALGAAFLVAAAPEPWLHASLCLTNLPAAALFAAGFLTALGGAWALYVRAVLSPAGSLPVRAELLPDRATLGAVSAAFASLVLDPGLLGWTFPALGIALAVDLLRRAARRPAGSSPFPYAQSLMVLATSAAALILAYALINPSFGGGSGSYIANSFKRALFYLLPPAAVTLLLAPPVRGLVLAFDRWQRA